MHEHPGVTGHQIVSALGSASRYFLPALSAAWLVWLYGEAKYSQGWCDFQGDMQHAKSPICAFSSESYLLAVVIVALSFVLAKCGRPRLAGVLAAVFIALTAIGYVGQGV